MLSKEATIIRRQRLRSIETIHHDELGEKFETAKRLLLKPFKTRKERKNEIKLKQYCIQSKESCKNNEFDLDRTKKSKNFNIYNGEGDQMVENSQVDTIGLSTSQMSYDLSDNILQVRLKKMILNLVIL